jgi:hypothetical protein
MGNFAGGCDGPGTAGPAAGVLYRLLHLPPALKDVSFTMGTLPRTLFRVALDFRQLRTAIAMMGPFPIVISAISILQGTHLFFKNHRLCYRHEEGGCNINVLRMR